MAALTSCVYFKASDNQEKLQETCLPWPGCKDLSPCSVRDASSSENGAPLPRAWAKEAQLWKLWPDLGFDHWVTLHNICILLLDWAVCFPTDILIIYSFGLLVWSVWFFSPFLWLLGIIFFPSLLFHLQGKRKGGQWLSLPSGCAAALPEALLYILERNKS